MTRQAVRALHPAGNCTDSELLERFVTVRDESASREHAIIAHDRDSGAYTIEDLQSTNGTRVNGTRVRTATLADGDEIQVGHTRFRFFWAPRPE